MKSVLSSALRAPRSALVFLLLALAFFAPPPPAPAGELVSYQTFSSVPMYAGYGNAARTIVNALEGRTRLELLIDGDSNETQSAAGGLSLACRNLSLLPLQAPLGGLWSSGWIQCAPSSSTNWTAKCPVMFSTSGIFSLYNFGDGAGSHGGGGPWPYDTWKAIGTNEAKLFAGLPAGWMEKAGWSGTFTPIVTDNTNTGVFFELQSMADNFPPELGTAVGPGSRWWPVAESDTYIDVAFLRSSLTGWADEAHLIVSPTDTLSALITPIYTQNFTTGQGADAALSLTGTVVAGSMLDSSDLPSVVIRRFGPLTWQVSGVSKKAIQVTVNSSRLAFTLGAGSGTYTVGETVIQSGTLGEGKVVSHSGGVLTVEWTKQKFLGSSNAIVGQSSSASYTPSSLAKSYVNVLGARFVRPFGKGVSFLPFSAQASHSAATHNTLYTTASPAYAALTAVDPTVVRGIYVELGVNSGYVDLATADTYVSDTLTLVNTRRAWLGSMDIPVYISIPPYHDNQLWDADAQDAIYDTYADAMYQAVIAGRFGNAMILNTRRFTDALGLNRSNENLNNLLTTAATLTASASTTVTASAASFNAGHIGKSIVIESTGTYKITAYTDSTHVTIASSITCSAKRFMFAPDMQGSLQANVYEPFNATQVFTIGAVSGAFTIGETIRQSTTNATGVLAGYVDSSTMVVVPKSGTFSGTDVLNGVTSTRTVTPSAVAAQNNGTAYDLINCGPAPVPILVRQANGTLTNPISATSAPGVSMYVGAIRNYLAVGATVTAGVGVGDGSHFSVNGLKMLRDSETRLLVQGAYSITAGAFADPRVLPR